MWKRIVTPLIVVLAVAVHVTPSMQEGLTYDRIAILNGELWRLFTWPLIHFNRAHFIYDILAFAVAGALVEARGIRRFGVLCWITSIITAVLLLLVEPELRFCGGLSGLATMAVVLLCLDGWAEREAWGWICRIGAVLVPAKILLETTRGGFVFLRDSDPAMVVVPACHFAGAAMAIVFAAVNRVQSAPKRCVCSSGVG